MNRWSITTFALLLFCSSSFAADWRKFDGYGIYPVADKSNCVFPFTYQNKQYTDCTIDGDNGKIPWCSMTAEYADLITYCYDFRKAPLLNCLPSYTMPNNVTYTGCDYLSTTAKYKQCRTNSTSVKYRYCSRAHESARLKPIAHRDNCDPAYKNLSNDHTMCFGPSPYATVAPFTDDEKQALLDIHNDYRRAVPSRYMFKLYWDDELAKLAQAHSNLCAFEHDLAVNRLSPKFNWKNGQNIVMSSEIRSPPSSLIDMMLNSEQENFHYGGKCSPGDNTCLHYTQAMISNLTRMGCGQTHCVYPDRIERFVTCNYIQSQYSDNYQTPYVPNDEAAVDCPSHQDNGLCDCGDKICAYDQGEYLEPSTCDCVSSDGKRVARSIDENERELLREAKKTEFVGVKTADQPKQVRRDLQRLIFGRQQRH